MGIGKVLKDIRKQKDITLADVADKTELSIGFLSNLEHDQTSPTIDVLHKICNALNITLNDVLQNDNEPKADSNSIENGEYVVQEDTVVRKEDRKLLFRNNDGGLSYSSMTKGNTDFKVSAMTISGNELYKFAKHDHDELGICISGNLEMQLDGQSYFLYPGDSIYIKAGTMHYGRKHGDEACVSHWVKLSTNLNDIVKAQK